MKKSTNKSLRFIAVALATVVAAALMIPHKISAVSPTPPAAAPTPTPQYVKGEVLVKFKPSATLPDRHATIMLHQHALLADLPQPGWTHLKLGSDQKVEEVIAAYKNDPSVEYAQPNYIYHTTAIPNDTQYGQLWALKNTGQTVKSILQEGDTMYSTHNPGIPGADINIEKAWDHITDCSSVVVAVVDSGVNYNHEELASNVWNGGAEFAHHGYDFVDDDDDPMDLNGHGTHVAGIIGAAGNNAKGTTGICWKARIMAVRVMGAGGHGDTAAIVKGVDFAVNNGAKVINMSIGGSDPFDPLYSESITSAQRADIVVVVSAGNDTTDNDGFFTPSYPCNFTNPNLICVAALDQSYQLASFSNYGWFSVDVGAPGANILSSWAGTSGKIADSLTSEWTFTPATGSWAYGTLQPEGVTTSALLNPPTYPNSTYKSSTDARAYKQFNLAGKDVALLRTSRIVDLPSGDTQMAYYNKTGGDPFGIDGTMVRSETSQATSYPYFSHWETDLSGCKSATCSVGFQRLSDATLPKDLGVGIIDFKITTLALNTTSYNTARGTSMASPVVAGLATMLRAHNPRYTYTEVINAIKKGGQLNLSLIGNTTTSNAIDVMSSLAFINQPTGLEATVK
ncbi:S8 family serine peptidase [Bdellovibrionota bacterium FG-2]